MKRFIGLLMLCCFMATGVGFASETNLSPTSTSLTAFDDSCYIVTDITTENVINVAILVSYTDCDRPGNELAILTPLYLGYKSTAKYCLTNDWLRFRHDIKRSKAPLCSDPCSISIS